MPSEVAERRVDAEVTHHSATDRASAESSVTARMGLRCSTMAHKGSQWLAGLPLYMIAHTCQAVGIPRRCGATSCFRVALRMDQPVGAASGPLSGAGDVDARPATPADYRIDGLPARGSTDDP
jgi:hypothetical protein